MDFDSSFSVFYQQESIIYLSRKQNLNIHESSSFTSHQNKFIHFNYKSNRTNKSLEKYSIRIEQIVTAMQGLIIF